MINRKKKNFSSLFLPPPVFSAEKEKAFSQYYRKKTISATRFAMALGLFLYAIFGILDGFIVPAVKYPVWFIRYAIVCPLFLTTIIYTYLSRKTGRIQSFTTIAVIIAGIGIAIMMYLDTGYGGIIYYGGLLLVIFFAYTFVKLQFKHAVICGWTVTLYYTLSAILDKKMNFILLTNNLFFLISANIIGMPVAYVMESYLRKEYQGTITLKKLLKQVHRMSIVDDLTKVSNRRFFNMRFPEEFNRMRRIKQPLSLLVVDIDFFKEYNDRFGHKAGDECLIKIAGFLKQYARRAGDLVARPMVKKSGLIGNLVTRWGGEEFVIILAGATLENAYIIAEKIRQLVLGLNIPHPGSKVAGVVTVSIGVSSLIPSADNNCDMLFSAADSALFKAKENGRNRVVKRAA